MKPRATIIKPTLLWLFGLLPALCACYLMCTHWVPVPYWDEWDTPGAQLASYYRGTLTLADLFSQHNEHRLFIPRLLWLPLAILAGWDVRVEMVLTFGIVCLGSFGIYKLLRSTGGAANTRLMIFGLINFLLFSPRQEGSFLMGSQGQTFFPTVALIFALLVNLSNRALRTKTILNVLLAFVATYSFGNGLLVWLLAFPIETRPDTDSSLNRAKGGIFWRAVYFLMAALCFASYFISYRHPPLSPPLVSPLAREAAFIHFVFVWIGSLFSVGAPAMCGVIVLLLFVTLACVAVWQMRRTGVWQPYYSWLVLGCYILASGAVAAMARLGFEQSMAGDWRYTAFSAFFYVAVVGLGFSLFEQANRTPLLRRTGPWAGVAFLALVLTMWTITLNKECDMLRLTTAERKHLLLVVRWSDAIPENPEIAAVSPYSHDVTLDTIRTLAKSDVLRPRLVTQQLARAVQIPPNSEATTSGKLEEATSDGAGHVRFKGWARIPDQNRAADCVVLGFETNGNKWQPFCVLETGQPRLEIAEQMGSRSVTNAGFSRTVLSRDSSKRSAIMRAWAIDLATERAFPMAGAVPVEFGR